MKLKDVFNDLQIDTLFERTDEMIDANKLVELSFDVPDEDEMKDQIEKITKNTNKLFKEILLGRDGLSIDRDYGLFRDIINYYHKNFYKNVKDALTFAILIPNITTEILESRKLIEIMEKTINYAIKDNPILNCTYRTCIVRYNNNTSNIDIHFVHHDDPEQDRRFTLNEKAFDKESMKNDASVTVCIHISILNGVKNNILIKFISNDAMSKIESRELNDDELKAWNNLFDYKFKHLMEFEHIREGEDDVSGKILHNIHL